MKKQAYLKPQTEVVRLKMSGSLLLTASNITSVSAKSGNYDLGIEWGGKDNTGEALSRKSVFDDDWE